MRGNRELSDKHLPGQGFQCQTSVGAKEVVRSDQVLDSFEDRADRLFWQVG